MILLVAGSITNLLHWWSILGTLSPLFGYYLEPTKCWLIVKPRMKDIALKAFENTVIQLTLVISNTCYLELSLSQTFWPVPGTFQAILG